MNKIINALIALSLLIHFSDDAIAKNKSKIDVSVFSGKEANVNAFVLSDDQGTIIVDATRNSKEAKELADLARSKKGSPKIIFITHGHPDHYMGMSVLKKEFPHAKILVANQQVKDDLIAFAKRAETMKWMDNEPSMKSKSDSNPNGFDYQNEIGVLDSATLKMPGGETFEVNTDFPATEAAHETVLFSRELNALFASDLVYNKVHLWLAGSVDGEAIQNWLTELGHLKKKYGPLKSRVYPGHGKPTDVSIFDTDKKYINDLLTIVKNSVNVDEAKQAMMNKYPQWENADFILVQSIKNLTKMKTSSPRALLAYLKVQPGTEAQFLEAAKNVIIESRKEPGNLVYTLQRSVTDPQQFVFYELFKSDADLGLHRRSKHTVDFLKQVNSILIPGQFILTEYDNVDAAQKLLER